MQLTLPSSDTPRASIIIVATSSPALLSGCLQSIARFAPTGVPFETIVVTNGWTAAAEAELRQNVGGITVINSPVNLGLAGAGNRGRSLARGEYLVLLHDDSEIEAGWLEALVETADAHPEAGAVGGKVLHPDGRLQSAGMILWADATTRVPWVGEAPPATAFDGLRAVDYCGTSSLLVRASAWDAVGGLEERLYPVYFVDVDLSMALRQLGLVVLYQPNARIRHHQGASGSLRLRRFTTDRNKVFFVQKWRDALARHLPPGSSQADVEHAIEASQAFAAECRRKGPPLLRSQRRPIHAETHERMHYELNRQFQQDYIRFLTETLDAKAGELSHVQDALRQKEQRLQEALTESKKQEEQQRQQLQEVLTELKKQEAQQEQHLQEVLAELKKQEQQLQNCERDLHLGRQILGSRSALARRLARMLLLGKRAVK